MLNKIGLGLLLVGMMVTNGCATKHMPDVPKADAFTAKAVPTIEVSPEAPMKKGEVRLKNGERWFKGIVIPEEE